MRGADGVKRRAKHRISFRLRKVDMFRDVAAGAIYVLVGNCVAAEPFERRVRRDPGPSRGRQP